MTFRVELNGPLDIPLSIDGLRRWGDDLIDRWDGERLIRTIRINGSAIPYLARVTGTLEAPALTVDVDDPRHATTVEQIVRVSFVSAQRPLEMLQWSDPAVARLAAMFPGVRPFVQHDLLTALVRSISAQQINLRFAATLRHRLAEQFGQPHEIQGAHVRSLEPERLAALTPQDLRPLQFSGAKADYVIAAAQAVANGTLLLDELRPLPDDEVIARITTVRGLGRWTAEWLLARTLGRPRVVAGDLGVRKAVGLLYLDGRLPSEAEVRQITAHWGAAAGVVQQFALHGLTSGRLAPIGPKGALIR